MTYNVYYENGTKVEYGDIIKDKFSFFFNLGYVESITEEMVKIKMTNGSYIETLFTEDEFIIPINKNDFILKGINLLCRDRQWKSLRDTILKLKLPDAEEIELDNFFIEAWNKR